MLKKAIVIGATGLVGELLTEMLLKNDNYAEVSIFVRKKTGIQHAKLKEIVIDFDNMATLHQNIQADVAFCCLGTTIAKAGSKEAFFRIDYDYVVGFARQCRIAGVKHFLVISALGADARSINFYNRVKGKMENGLKDIGFEHLSILQPSLLLGNRKEMRMGEDLGKVVNFLFGFIIPDRYKAIEGKQVAFAMLKIAQSEDVQGVRFYESEMLRRII